jgi:hypothetical protein
MLQRKLARKHGLNVLSSCVPIGATGSKNMMTVHRLGETKGLERKG